MSDSDYITLNTGKQYAYGKIIGMSLDAKDSVIYSGYDNEVGEFSGGLTRDEKKELARLMVARWKGYLKELCQ